MRVAMSALRSESDDDDEDERSGVRKWRGFEFEGLGSGVAVGGSEGEAEGVQRS